LKVFKKNIICLLFFISIGLIAYQSKLVAKGSVNNSSNKFSYKHSVGANFYINNSFYNSNFKKLPGVPNCCPSFKSANGLGFNLGLNYRYKINNKYKVGFSVQYNTLNGSYSPTETMTLIDTELGAVDGEITHFLDANFTLLNFTPEFIYNPIENLNLIFNINLDIPLSASYEQKSKITDPAYKYTFLDSNGNDSGKRVRNAFSGNLNDLSSLFISTAFAVSYDFPLNKEGSLFIAPKLAYDYYLKDVITSLDWKISNLYFGVNLEYRFAQTENQEEKHIEPDKIEIKKTQPLILLPEIRAVGIDGKESTEIVSLRVEEFINNKLYPILPYIFFDENSNNINSRYKLLKKSETKSFNSNDLYSDSTLGVYYNILNIVAERMLKNPNASMTLLGCNSDQNQENNNLELSKNRAISIREYFTNVWGIDKSRFILKSRNLPIKYSNPGYTEGDEENRRVELIPNDKSITKFLFLNDTLRVTNPPRIRFYPSVKSNNGLQKWEITVSQKNTIYKKFSGTSQISKHLDWTLSKEKNTIPRFDTPLLINLSVWDKKGNKKEKQIELKLNQITISKKRTQNLQDKEINEYNLILFDYNKAELGKDNLKITDLINEIINDNSIVTIYGFTDKLGDSEYNKSLAKKRAESTKNSLNTNNTVFKGIGEDNLLFENTFPEGRMYCRTVIVRVETPTIKDD